MSVIKSDVVTAGAESFAGGRRRSILDVYAKRGGVAAPDFNGRNDVFKFVSGEKHRGASVARGAADPVSLSLYAFLID